MDFSSWQTVLLSLNLPIVREYNNDCIWYSDSVSNIQTECRSCCLLDRINLELTLKYSRDRELNLCSTRWKQALNHLMSLVSTGNTILTQFFQGWPYHCGWSWSHWTSNLLVSQLWGFSRIETSYTQFTKGTSERSHHSLSLYGCNVNDGNWGLRQFIQI